MLEDEEIRSVVTGDPNHMFVVVLNPAVLLPVALGPVGVVGSGAPPVIFRDPVVDFPSVCLWIPNRNVRLCRPVARQWGCRLANGSCWGRLDCARTLTSRIIGHLPR